MKTSLILIAVVAIIVGGALTFARGGVPTDNNVANNVAVANNVHIVDGKQIIDIRVKGGYQPRVSVAKAGIPSIIRFNTNGTFDCSSSIRIPSMNISKILPQTGTTDIDIGSQQVATLQGTCGMGMYQFEVQFQS